MILVALGGNLAGPWGSPDDTLRRALQELDRCGSRVVAVSPLILTAPFGRLNQPPFVNAVARLETHLPPQALMQRLHAIERAAGRRRTIPWGPRTLDLDLIDYHGVIRAQHQAGMRGVLALPHPGITERRFVLEPIARIAPRWRHPVNRLSADQMLRRLEGTRQGRAIRGG